MRWAASIPGVWAVVLVAISAAFGPRAAAAPVAPRPTEPPTLSGDRDFWEWLEHPHRAEVEAALEKIEASLESTGRQVNTYLGFDLEPDLERRRRTLRKTFEIIQQARQLDPDHLELLRYLGIVASELGMARTARSALTQYMDREESFRVDSDARLVLARLLADTGQIEAALAQLRQGVVGRWRQPMERQHAVVSLATLLMEQGLLAEAIDLLLHDQNAQQMYPHEGLLPRLALAVAYDRDEQLTRAHQVLSSVSQNQNSYPTALLADWAGQPVAFVPAIDQHYFAALLLEMRGQLPEARTEWQHYAGHPQARYRRRALAHLADIDVILGKPSSLRTAK